MNTHFNWVRRKAGLEYWSLSAYLKQRVKRAVNFIGEFESALVLAASERGVDGVICGHIHQVAMKQIGDILYINTGDWVESCTAVGETMDGRFELISWVNGQAVIVGEDEKEIVDKSKPMVDAA